MTIDFPEFVLGWFYHDDNKEKYIVSKEAPREVVDYFKDIDDGYFDIYSIHIVEFEKNEKSKTTNDSMLHKLKSYFIK